MARKKYVEMSLKELQDLAMWYGDQLEFLTFMINKRISAGEK